MNSKKLSVPESQHLFILVSVLLLLTVGCFALLFHQYRQNYIPPEQLERLSLERSVIASFAGREDTSADAPSLNRLVRGKLTGIDEKMQTITLAAYVNFPDTSVTREITLSLTPRTQFLCWTKMYRGEDGAVIDVEKAGYLLDENTKLFQRGERRIELNEARSILFKHPKAKQAMFHTMYETNALVALETPYSLHRENRAFQVALLGCDEN